ncbi:MAG TPA: FlgD immunoglobulin-like domain containing protein, partial [Candidatus Eisenbacteria bacterium]|nr:FlgD immunoglobulin-like domain containing protein [Candidatus Eisenbacteria bacterium]
SETEWLRQNVTLTGAAGAESLQVRFTVADYSRIFCDGVGSAANTAMDIDNVDIRVLSAAGPVLSTSESNLFQDTFRTTAFLGNDNINTPRGDSTTVRIGASRGLKLAKFRWSIGGAPFSEVNLTPVGAAAPDIFFGDVPAGAYPRGTTVRYYFKATDSTDAVATLPLDAEAPQPHYFTASILPAQFTPPTPNCPSDTARVLYVNSYAGPNAVTGVDQSLAALGLRYDRYDVNDPTAGNGNGPGGGDPSSGGVLWPTVSASALAAMYSAIIWDVGERSNFTLTAQDQTLLQSWLGTPGKNRGLLLAGDNLAYDLSVNGGGATFLTCTAGAAYAQDSWITPPQSNPNPNLSGEPGTRIALESFPLAGGCPSLNRFDALNVAPCVGAAGRVWLRYPSGSVAATERRAPLTGTDSLKSVLLGFSLGTMTNTTRRTFLLWKTVVEEMEVPYCVTPTEVATTEVAPPRGGRIESAIPNPFNPSTLLRFSVARTGPVRLLVYSVAGARVRTLVDAPLTAGPHEVRWDGKDDGGRDAGSGTYFVRLEGGGDPVSRKVVLLR